VARDLVSCTVCIILFERSARDILMFQYPSSAVSLFNNISGISTHLKILSAEEFKQGDNEATPTKITGADRVVIAVMAIFSEAAVWIAMLFSGTLFIFQATSNEEVIRSTVAITFIMNIDELIYSACCPANNKKNFTESSFGARPSNLGSTKQVVKQMMKAWDYGQLYILMCLSFIIVASMRSGCKDPATGVRGFNFYSNTKALDWDSFFPP